MPRRNLLAIALAGVLSILCWQAGKASQRDESMELYGLFVDAVEQVEANYVRPVSRKELLENALKGMLHELDPHSNYISGNEWKSFRRQIDGKFGGVGIQVEIDPHSRRLSVVAPMVGTPAYLAGILSGDLILEVDGVSTENIDVDKAVELLQGQPGTPVKMTVRHEGAKKEDVITVKRAIIDVPSVLADARKADDSWDFMIDKPNKIAYIRVTGFIQNTVEELRNAITEIKEAGAEGIIVDLRNDPGGLLSAAVDVSDMFLQEGKIVSTKGRNSPEKSYEARKDAVLPEIPMAVLINHGSASASEIVAACLQDHDRAVVVGERSYGKGSVQNIIDLDDGKSVLKLTVATYWRPSGKNIHRFKDAKESDEWGVSPNQGMEVKFTPEEYIAWARDRRLRDLITHGAKPVIRSDDDADKNKKEPEKPFVDRQLTKAIEAVKDKIAKARAGEPKKAEAAN